MRWEADQRLVKPAGGRWRVVGKAVTHKERGGFDFYIWLLPQKMEEVSENDCMQGADRPTSRRRRQREGNQ